MNTVRLYFKTPELKVTRKPACDRVLEHFNLPTFRLLCFFDDENPVEFDFIGSSYCGFHSPVIASGLPWPSYIDDLFIDSTGNFVYDNVVYVNGRTCSSLPGAVVTLAHELQHFIQYGYTRKVWRANTLIYNILHDGPPTTIKAWDIPYERDTMRVSKRVAGRVLGEDIVKAYAEAQIAAGNDPEKWKFFLSVSCAAPFDLLTETKPWVDKYKAELEKIEQSEVDFSQNEWWR
jgi:glycogen debranching enzyme